MYLSVTIASIILFVVVLHFIDKNNVETHKPPLTNSSKVGLFIACVIICISVGTLMSDEKPVVGGGDYAGQEIYTGFPEF